MSSRTNLESQEQQVTVSEQSPSEDLPVCRFYNSRRGCRLGTQCRFRHVARDTVPQGEESSAADGENGVSVETEHAGGSAGRQTDAKDAAASKSSPGREKVQVQQLCRFYRRGQWCRFGNTCRFLHQRVTRNTEVGEEDPDSRKDDHQGSTQSARRTRQNKKLCKYFKNGHCTMEDKCRFFHPKSLDSIEVSNDSKPISSTPQGGGGEAYAQQPLVPQNTQNPSQRSHVSQPARQPVAKPGRPSVRMDGATDEELSKLQQTEISLLRKRYSEEAMEEVTEEGANYKAFKIQVSPSDPDWPFDIHVFELYVKFPEKYPTQVADISLPIDQALPETVIRHINKEVEDWLHEKQTSNETTGRAELMFRPFLHWFDRNLEDMFTEAAKLFKKEVVANAAGLEFVSFQSLPGAHVKDKGATVGNQDSHKDRRPQPTVPAASVEVAKIIRAKSSRDEPQKYQAPSETKEKAASQERDQGQRQEHGKAPEDAAQVRSAPVKKGTEAKFTALELAEEVATVYTQQAVLTVQCIRCKSRHDVKTRRQQVHVITCQKCQHQYKVAFRPAVIHHYSPVIGYFDLDGCVPFDLIVVDCEFLIGCLQCDKETSFKGVQPGQHRDMRCSHCHQKLRLKGSSVKFTQLQPSQPSGNGQVIHTQTKSKRVPKDPAIQEGLPLPSNGTCKHYKKSFRWLRFPCCGRTYPCDVCHDEDQGDHEMKLANRMICGFCAKEQPFAADKPCILCGSNMKKGGGSHWEGGKGCRDRIKMSRNDTQKYQGINKTVSRKEQEKKEPKKKAKKSDK